MVLIYFLRIETLGLPKPSCIQDSAIGFLFPIFPNCRPVPYASMSRPQLWRSRASDPLRLNRKTVGFLQESRGFSGPLLIPCAKEPADALLPRVPSNSKISTFYRKQCDNGEVSCRGKRAKGNWDGDKSHGAERVGDRIQGRW